MIYFFHKREEKPDKGGFLKWYCDKVKEPHKEKVEIYKLFYDMADYIYDKRFDGGYKDKELYRYVTGKEKPEKKEEFDEAERLRFKALNKINQELDRHAPQEGDSEECLLQNVLFCLTKGNVCLRISHYHTHYYSYAESDLYGKKAQELLWRAKQLAGELSLKLERKKMPAAQKTEKRDEYYLYVRLIKLNLAKFHRNFARKNRRSDYDAALDEYYHTCSKIQQRFGKVGKAWKRQYALIWLDAVSDIAFIHRNNNMMELAHKETILVYCELKKIMAGCDISWGSRSCEQFWLDADQLLREDRKYWRKNRQQSKNEGSFWDGSKISLTKLKNELSSENNYNHFLDDFTVFIQEGLMEESSSPDVKPQLSYDISRFFMLVLNELSVLRSSLHDTECYKAAVKTAKLADDWARILDGDFTSDKKEKHSIDAYNNMSLALRKYFKFTQETGKQTNNDPMGESEFHINELPKLLYLLFEYAEGNYTSRSELIKWYCLSLEMSRTNGEEIRKIQKKVDEDTYLTFWEVLENHFPELKRGIKEGDNIQNLFLCGLLLYRLQAYSDAMQYLQAVLKHGEADYIRVGSLGTKTRFLLASCLISQGKYKAAEKILLEMKEAMEFTYMSKGGDSLPHEMLSRYQDERIETNLAFCYMMGGDYNKARGIYEELFGWLLQKTVQAKPCKGEEKENDYSFKTEYRRLKPARQIYGLCNLAGCLIFSDRNFVKSKKLGLTYTLDDIFLCIENVREVKKGRVYRSSHKKSELFKGYKRILFPMANADGAEESRKENLSAALKHFEDACNKANGFFLDEKNYGESHESSGFHVERNESWYREKIEAFSAYIITLIDLSYEVMAASPGLTEKDRERYEKIPEVKNIKKILLSLPESVEVSLKAAISIAEWILKYKKNAAASRKNTLVPQLFRSFSYLNIYEERGARVFNELKEERGFRFFSPEQRGEILARLLLFYQPIKRIKEEYSLCLNDKPKEIHLYHYTSIDTLKALLSVNPEDRPLLRINNCGYMNDMQEGSAFLKKLENMYGENVFSDTKPWKAIQDKYYPQLNQSSDHMIPSSSDVYIACVSVRQDSFPLWSIYGNREFGCNIEFEKDFFDIAGAAYKPQKLRKYIMSRYTDDDYPLYKVHYLSGNDLKDCNVISAEKERTKTMGSIRVVEQACGTSVPEIAELNRCLAGLTNRLVQFDDYLDELYGKNGISFSEELLAVEDPRDTLRRFAANRMDEIRFLFKNNDYSYESEIRTVYTVSSRKDASTKPRIDVSADTPGVYVEMNREIKDVTVTLGSLIDDSKIDKYVTWLKQTGKVKRVRLAVTNRKNI